MKRWAFYGRISDGEQIDNFSLEAQRAAAERFVQDRGGTIVARFEDVCSGRQADNRPEFRQMIAAAADGAFDDVVVHKFDRFARNRKDSVVYKALLKARGVHVWSALEPTDPESPTSILFEGMLEVFAEYFSANLGQEVRKGLERRALKGLPCGSPAYGYTIRDGTLEPTADLEMVKVAIDTYLTGTATDMDIVRLLNSSGPAHRDPDGTLEPFSRNTVRYILTNPIYAGYIRHNDTLIKGNHRGIITLDQHYALLRLRQRFYRSPRDNRRSARVYPFGGIIRCGQCGGLMGSSYAESGGHGRTTYRCLDRAQGKTVCTQPAVPSRFIEAAVDDTMRDMRMPMAVLDMAWSLSDPVRDAARVAAQRKSLQERLRRVQQLYLDEAVSEGQWAQEKARITHELHMLPETSDLPQCLPLPSDDLTPLAWLWRRANPGEQKLLARLLFERIVVDVHEVTHIALTALAQRLTSQSGIAEDTAVAGRPFRSDQVSSAQADPRREDL